jgi:hypothetical protein
LKAAAFAAQVAINSIRRPPAMGGIDAIADRKMTRYAIGHGANARL